MMNRFQTSLSISTCAATYGTRAVGNGGQNGGTHTLGTTRRKRPRRGRTQSTLRTALSSERGPRFASCRTSWTPASSSPGQTFSRTATTGPRSLPTSSRAVVGPCRLCSPRRPTHLNLCLLNKTASYDVASNILYTLGSPRSRQLDSHVEPSFLN